MPNLWRVPPHNQHRTKQPKTQLTDYSGKMKIDKKILPAFHELPEFIRRLRVIYETGYIAFDCPDSAGVPCRDRLKELFYYYTAEPYERGGYVISGTLRHWSDFYPIVSLVRLLKKMELLDSATEYDNYDPSLMMEFNRRYAGGNSPVWPRWINEPWLREHKEPSEADCYTRIKYDELSIALVKNDLQRLTMKSVMNHIQSFPVTMEWLHNETIVTVTLPNMSLFEHLQMGIGHGDYIGFNVNGKALEIDKDFKLRKK